MLRRSLLKILGISAFVPAGATIPALGKENRIPDSDEFNKPLNIEPLNTVETDPERADITATWIVNETLSLIHERLPNYPTLTLLKEEDQEDHSIVGRALGTAYGPNNPYIVDSKNLLKTARMIGTECDIKYDDWKLTRDEFSKKYLGAVASALAEEIKFHNPTVCAECILPKGVEMAVRVTMKDSGLSLRYVRAYDVSRDAFISRFDMILA